MGRPRNPDSSVVKVAEALNITLASDVMSLDQIKDFPQLENESERNQGLMLAVACGYSQRFVGKMFGIDQTSVRDVVNRIDPQKMLRATPEGKRAFITSLYETRGMEALSSITAEKLEEASASELARIAKTCSDAAMSMNQSKHKSVTGSKLDMLMEAMVLEAEEAEDAVFEEVTENK